MAESRSTTDGLNDVRDMLSGGEFLKTKDVEAGDLTFGITHVEKVTFKPKGEKTAEKKLVLTLGGDPVRKLSLNDTNLRTLIDAWGHDAARWVGKVFDAYYDKTVRDPSGKRTGGLRVRPRETVIVAAQVGAGKPNGSGTAAEPHDESIPF